MKSIKFENGSEILFSNFDKSEDKFTSLSNPPTMPLPPPMRQMTTGGRWVNEWETVEWYTGIVSHYPRKLSKWDLFFDKKLRDAYNENINRTPNKAD